MQSETGILSEDPGKDVSMRRKARTSAPGRPCVSKTSGLKLLPLRRAFSRYLTFLTLSRLRRAEPPAFTVANIFEGHTGVVMETSNFNCILELREEEHSIWPLRVLAVIVVAARLLFGGDAMMGGNADERADNKVVAQKLVVGVLA